MAEKNTRNLKEILFETLSGLMDKSIDVPTAKAISDTAQTILNAAKVEMEFARLCQQKPENWLANSDSGFADRSAIPEPSRKGITHPRPGVTSHRIT